MSSTPRCEHGAEYCSECGTPAMPTNRDEARREAVRKLCEGPVFDSDQAFGEACYGAGAASEREKAKAIIDDMGMRVSDAEDGRELAEARLRAIEERCEAQFDKPCIGTDRYDDGRDNMAAEILALAHEQDQGGGEADTSTKEPTAASGSESAGPPPASDPDIDWAIAELGVRGDEWDRRILAQLKLRGRDSMLDELGEVLTEMRADGFTTGWKDESDKEADDV